MGFSFFCMFVCFVFVFVLVGFILLRGDLSQSFWLSRESIHIPGWPQIHIILPQPPKVLSWLTCTTPPRLWVTICDCSVFSNINLFFTTTEEKMEFFQTHRMTPGYSVPNARTTRRSLAPYNHSSMQKCFAFFPVMTCSFLLNRGTIPDHLWPFPQLFPEQLRKAPIQSIMWAGLVEPLFWKGWVSLGVNLASERLSGRRDSQAHITQLPAPRRLFLWGFQSIGWRAVTVLKMFPTVM